MDGSSKIIVNELIKVLSGKRITDVINLETDNIYNKSAISHIIKNYINKNCIYNADIFHRQNIRLKFVSVSPDYKCFEALSFSNSSLYDIIFEDWNSKDILDQPNLKKQLNFTFAFIPIIKIKKNGLFNHYSEWEIGNISVWKPNSNELELIGKEWTLVKQIIQKGVKITRVRYGKSFRNNNNLPKMSETISIHLRPHGKNSFDYDLNYAEYRNIEITKQSFWLNKMYINALLKKYKWKTNSKEE